MYRDGHLKIRMDKYRNSAVCRACSPMFPTRIRETADRGSTTATRTTSAVCSLHTLAVARIARAANRRRRMCRATSHQCGSIGSRPSHGRREADLRFEVSTRGPDTFRGTDVPYTHQDLLFDNGVPWDSEAMGMSEVSLSGDRGSAAIARRCNMRERVGRKPAATRWPGVSSHVRPSTSCARTLSLEHLPASSKPASDFAALRPVGSAPSRAATD